MLSDKDVIESVSSGYATLETIDELVVEEKDVETEQGRFRVRALDFGEVVSMKEEVEDASEWESTKILLAAGLVEPSVTIETAETLGRLRPKTIGKIVEAITEISGMEQDDDEKGTVSFKDASRIE